MEFQSCSARSPLRVRRLRTGVATFKVAVPRAGRPNLCIGISKFIKRIKNIDRFSVGTFKDSFHDGVWVEIFDFRFDFIE